MTLSRVVPGRVTSLLLLVVIAALSRAAVAAAGDTHGTLAPRGMHRHAPRAQPPRGAPSRNAREALPSGRAIPPSFGAAGPPPIGAAGPPPLGAAGPPPIGAAGPPPIGPSAPVDTAPFHGAVPVDDAGDAGPPPSDIPPSD